MSQSGLEIPSTQKCLTCFSFFSTVFVSLRRVCYVSHCETLIDGHNHPSCLSCVQSLSFTSTKVGLISWTDAAMSPLTLLKSHLSK